MEEIYKVKLDSLYGAFAIMANGAYTYLTDIKHNYSRWSKEAVDYFGLPSEYMENAGDVWMENVHPDDRAAYAASIKELFGGKVSEHNLQYRARTKDGKYIVCTCRGVVIRDENGEPGYFGGTIKNNDTLSYIDDISNFRSLYGFLEDLQSAQWKGESIQIMLLGINEFSRLNDIYGYTFGNRVLQEFAKMIDTEAHGMGEWYRMDGTKFAIVCKKSSVDDLKNLYKRIQYNSIHDFEVDGNRIVLSFVAGAINLDSLEVSAESVYSCLRFAYYESKNNHLGELFVLKNNVGDDKRFAIERINVIRNSIVNNCEGFFLCYQPIVDATTEKIIGAEALIRWKNDEYGVVPPVQFVDVLEQDNLFPELGKWILRTALVDAKKFLARYPGFIVNVNLSYTQLEKSDFAEDVLAIIEDVNFPPQNLCLEITERCRLLDMGLLKDIFTRLRKHGIKVALDDFGTGFSSIGVLRELPVTTVKIDRSFVMNIEKNNSDQNTVRFISELADSFSSSVTAEGIETPEMRELLLRFKIKSLQGFYYSKPLPMDEFMDKYVNA
ncbi:MAG: EAL domain-containing protein [Fibrobacter sp.]|nr:EAL domain-containing protein [Fibrobacter sp.]